VVSPPVPAEVAAVRAAAAELAAIVTRPWTLMEVCGGQTHAIVRWGLDQLLPPGLELIHGPGCPVCVTPAALIDQALELARRPEVILGSYGDMLRVPGSRPGEDLLGVRAAGGSVHLLTAPLQAIDLALAHPDRQVVFLAVGFETTAPATALLARQALALGLENLSLLVAHVRVAPAMEAILSDPANRVEGFLAAGHVCSVLGTGELQALVAQRRRPVVVTGFEPLELMHGLLACVRQLEAGEARVQNVYGAVVRDGGNPQARQLLETVFAAVDRPWRGFGVIPAGGLELRQAYRRLDARERFALDPGPGPEAFPTDDCGPCRRGAGRPAARVAPSGAAAGEPSAGEPSCIAGRILRGQSRPDQCPAFGTDCTPERPLGAPMVSSEGACAAYFLYRRRAGGAAAPADPPLGLAGAGRG
jgi:hydrogenase expression/formation protein HypD